MLCILQGLLQIKHSQQTAQTSLNFQAMEDYPVSVGEVGLFSLSNLKPGQIYMEGYPVLANLWLSGVGEPLAASSGSGENHWCAGIRSFLH